MNFYDENEIFEKMINIYLGKINYSPYLKNCNNELTTFNIINLACGKCHEAETLIKLFGDNIYFIDNNPNELQYLENKLGKKNSNKIINYDAQKISKIFDKNSIDLIIARHPNTSKDNWSKIYNECFKINKSDGIIISTYYTNFDYSFGKEHMNKTNYNILISEQNPYSITYSDSNFIQSGTDKFIIIGEK
jgi:ubiquinone/menaquinone biosynthesis C-methylase UbiE